MSRKTPTRRRTARLRKQLLTLAAFGVYLVVATGVPLPLAWLPGVFGTDTTERFPCENCPCGCATAERCWKNCCCFDLEQKLAWAEREGVRAPAFVLAKAQANASKRRIASAQPAPKRSCCGGCCSKQQASKSAPGTPQQDRSVAASPREADDANQPGVSILRALGCHGFDENWSAAAFTAIPLEVAGCPNRRGLTDGPAPITVLFTSRATPPDPPPPRPRAVIG